MSELIFPKDNTFKTREGRLVHRIQKGRVFTGIHTTLLQIDTRLPTPTNASYTIYGDIGSQYTVDWGDGNVIPYLDPEDPTHSHTYAAPGAYTIKIITGPGQKFSMRRNVSPDQVAMTLIEQMGASPWSLSTTEY